MDLQSQVILGINCAHDASACLMIDGQIRVAILEERLSRKKHRLCKFFSVNSFRLSRRFLKVQLASGYDCYDPERARDR